MRGMSYREAIQYAKGEIRRHDTTVPIPPLKRGEKNTTIPNLKLRERWEPWELEYWREYGINEDDLQYERILPLDSLSWVDGAPGLRSLPGDPAFVYLLRETPLSFKIYRPFSEFKFRQWRVSGLWEGMLTVGDVEKIPPCLIVSSTKDRTIVRKALGREWTLLNPLSEGSWRYLPFSRMQGGCIMFDADDAGTNNAQDAARESELDYIDWRGKLGGEKDFSDFIAGVGTYPELRAVIISELRKINWTHGFH